jgi:hypothetical protein
MGGTGRKKRGAASFHRWRKENVFERVIFFSTSPDHQSKDYRGGALTPVLKKLDGRLREKNVGQR